MKQLCKLTNLARSGTPNHGLAGEPTDQVANNVVARKACGVWEHPLDLDKAAAPARLLKLHPHCRSRNLQAPSGHPAEGTRLMHTPAGWTRWQNASCPCHWRVQGRGPRPGCTSWQAGLCQGCSAGRHCCQPACCTDNPVMMEGSWLLAGLCQPPSRRCWQLDHRSLWAGSGSSLPGCGCRRSSHSQLW